ncbi:MAG: hypothetical protein Q9162_004929 [Coniocarpon cinnabarinum]
MSNTTLHSGRLGHHLNPLKRARTPLSHEDASAAGESAAEKELNPTQERRQRLLRDLYARSDRMIGRLLDGSLKPAITQQAPPVATSDNDRNTNPAQPKPAPPSRKRAAREIEEDDYDDDEDEEVAPVAEVPQITAPAAKIARVSSPHLGSTIGGPLAKSAPGSLFRGTSKEAASSPEEARKKLEAEKRATEIAAKESFLTTIYTLENDREAMLEQQKLDDLDRQVETETIGANRAQQATSQGQSSLNNSALGSAQLLLPNLVALLEKHRDKVPATEAEIKALLSNARIGGGKWANPEKIGQEELYESFDQVLNNLKGQIQQSAPFLQSVKKKEYPDYYKAIARPMDFGTMLRKLKDRAYRSKRDFTDDLDLIWANCLKYNTDPTHPYRRKAEFMRKEAAKLTPLIPDITVRDRAEVEAEEREERRRQFDDSDDDDAPIAATRGRKAPNKGAKGGSTARKAPPTASEDSPAPEPKPVSQAPPSGPLQNIRSDLDVAGEGSQAGLATPPVGNRTPLGAGSLLDGAGNNADVSELESVHANDAGALDAMEDLPEEDEEFKVWKQVTMKDRARMAAERHLLFQHDRINPEQPALLRTQRDMRRWVRHQRQLLGAEATKDLGTVQNAEDGVEAAPAQTLSEGMEADDDSVLPDYYYPVSGVPAIGDRLKWVEDSSGNVQDQRDECLRLMPSNYFSSPCTGKEDAKQKQEQRERGSLAFKIDANMAQMQETRKIMAKIGMVKQMQVQTQTYQNQFQKYEPQPFQEAEINAMPVSDDGPYMQPAISHAALQRSVSKLFYHAGFEDVQPSALDAVTETAAEYMQKLARTLLVYHQHPKVNPAVPESFIEPTTTANPAASPIPVINEWQPRFTAEESILHTLHCHGQDLEGLTSYVEDEVPRLGQKLAAQHEATKQHYADLLRPALDPTVSARDGGAGAFNDNSEQFLAGDFAEDIDEDYFGFKSLGLDIDFKGVPLHLLQSRFNSINQAAAGTGVDEGDGIILAEPPRWNAVTSETIESEIGLVQDFFKDKLEKSAGDALTEDEDLPAKQKFPKPRLPPNGKISSPRKRPIREQQMMARKKRRLEIEAERERERSGQDQASGEPSGPNQDGQGGGTVAVTNEDGLNHANLESNAVVAAETTDLPAPESGLEALTEEPSRNDSRTEATTNGEGVPNGVLTNGDLHHEEHESETPTLSKQLKLDRPSQEQPPPNTDPEKRGSLPIAAH